MVKELSLIDNMIGYKICKKKGKKYLSAYELGKDVRYRFRRWAKRPKSCGPLAVFATLKHVEKFLTITREAHVFKCEFKQSKDTELWTPDWYDSFMPNGTLFADKVKLLEKIPNWK